MANQVLLDIASEVETETGRLRDVFAAFVGLEKLISASGDENSQEINLEPRELGCLLQFLNEALQRQTEAIGAGVQDFMTELTAHIPLR